MDADSDIIYDSEPDRNKRAETSTRPLHEISTRNHLRRTSDERPGLSSEGSTAELERTRGRRKQRTEKPQEILVLDSGSEEDHQASATSSKYFSKVNASPKRRRTRSPPVNVSPEGWPFSGEVRIGSRSPPLASRRASSRSLSTSYSAGASPELDIEPLHPIASTSKLSGPTKASSPFTSALDLLHSRPPPPEDPFDYSVTIEDSTEKPSRSKSTISTAPNPPTRPRSRSKQPTLPLGQTTSASSIEIIDTNEKKKGKKKERAKSREEEEEEQDEMSEDLPNPDAWAGQTSHRNDTKESKSQTKSKGKGKEEVVTQSQAVKRRKPWELLEAKVAASGSTKKRPTVRTSKTKKSAAKKEEEETRDSDEDDEDLQVVSSRSTSSTALKPCPSGRLSHLAPSSSSFTKRKSAKIKPQVEDSTLFDAPPPLILPSDERLKCLTHCPLCEFASSDSRARTSVDSWGSKSLATRQSHLRLCAKSHDYFSETVSHLVNQQILVLSVESEEKRLERDLEKSLFDRAIGKGEGTSGREVTVVGIESSGGSQEGDKEWFKDVKEVQEEVDSWRKKSKRGGIEERLAKVAKEIKLELERATKADMEGVATEVEDGEEEPMPRATGRLRPETELDRDEVSKRAKELLDLANGTQLTRKTVLILDEDTSMEGTKVDGQDQDISLAPPPPTQTFEDSTLANRCDHDGAINIVRPLKSSSPTSKGKSRSPLHELDLSFSSDEEVSLPRTTSLWKANAGTDEASLSRIVHSHSAPFGSPTSHSPFHRISSPFLPSPTTALNPHLSSLTLSSTSSPSSTSSLSSLPDPSNLLRRLGGSSRNLATSTVRNRSLSPTPRRRHRREASEILLDEEEADVELERDLGSGEPRRQGRAEVEGEIEMEWIDEGEDGLDLGGVMLVGGAEEMRRGGEREVESSEEESLAQVVARTPVKSKSRKKKIKSPSPRIVTAKTKTTRRRISPSSPSASDSEPPPPSSSAVAKKRTGDPPGMPAYSSLPLSTLHKEVQKYGYRPSKEKSVVVQQLKDVWKAINKDKVEAWERGELDEAGKKVRAKGKKKVVSEKQKDDESSEKATTTKGRRKRRTIVDESETEEAEGETRTVGERLRELIVNEEQLYLRILRYEPIHLDEFILLAANNGVKVARTLLIRCLDEQSITFYQEDPTNGQRKRHK
ncbi:hypothetical protein JCM3765_000083 [Sporobolomyces pararoseus]